MARPDAWFRMYNAVVDNPKVQSLSDKQFRAWVNLLCVASQNGGKLPTYEDIAFKLRVTPAKAKAISEELEDRALFDRDEDGRLYPHDWNDLQFVSDTSTPRVKRFREKKRNVSETENETHGETDHRREEHKQIKEEPPKAPVGGDVFTKEFVQFWEQYPEKVGRKAAWNAWKKAKDRPEINVILAAIERYVRTKPSDRAYCNPTTWINQGRWNDQPAGSTVVPIASVPANDDGLWKLRVDGFYRHRASWLRDQWGPTPDEPGCRAPKSLLPKPRTAEDYLSAG